MNNQLEKEINQAYPARLTWQKSVPTFHAESAEEASDIFKLAARNHQQLFISGFGNIINPVGDNFKKMLVIKADRLNHIIEINPNDFYMTIGAGYPLIEINHILNKQGLWFPFGDTLYPGSFGGALAAGLSASDGVHDIPLMRSLLSLTAVLPDGNIVKPGAVTFKSVSGYDISRIFFNSWGLLGIIIRLSFRILPLSKKSGSPHLTLRLPDYKRFKKELEGEKPLGKMCREIKKEYDPANLIPVI
jgi:FAD/FMN-containing dehydrogenase